MAGIVKPPGAFQITPHKVSVCILLQIYAPPGQAAVPFPFSSAEHHNRFGLFLLALTKSYDDIIEPKLDDLIHQLKGIGGLVNYFLIDSLTNRLSSILSPDDLFNFFNDTRGVLGGADVILEADQVVLDPNSSLGMFVRRCSLAFNLLTFEGVCHLLNSIGMYCKEAISSCSTNEVPQLDDPSNDLETMSEYENMDLENFVFEKVTEEMEARQRASGRVSFHLHVPKALVGLVEDIEVRADPKVKYGDKLREGCHYAHPPRNTSRDLDPNGGLFLRTNWQVQGFLQEQADALEKQGGSSSLNDFELMPRQLQNLAPELHGIEGFDFVPSASVSDTSGRFEIALLCLGMMHFHFGHPKQSLEVLTEAVNVSRQQSNKTCLSYTLAAICNLLSETGISCTTGILGSSYSPLTRIGISLSVQQQLFVLLRGCLKRADGLKLKRLVASNHLLMAKFDLTHVQRPLVSFGPKASMKLKTSPVNVCKELRLSTQLISEFAAETSSMTTDGAFSTAWLKNLEKPMDLQVLSHESGGSRASAFQFCAEPSPVPASVLQLVGSSYLLRATAWETYGSTSLARFNAVVHATCFPDVSSTSDTALAYLKLIQHLAVSKGYKEAFSALKIATEKFLSVSKSRILLLKLQLLHERALHRGHLKLAQQVCDELGVLASSVTGVDMELKTEASLRNARTLLAANQFSEAAAVAHSLFCMCYKFNMQVENVTVLLLLAEIHKKSGNAVLGLPYALASLSFCQSFNLDLLKASAALTLAELWLALGSNHAKRALSLIHGAFPIILGQGGLELRARAYIVEAKCYLSDPGFSVHESPDIVLDPLRQASDELQLLEYHELAAEAFYLMAIVFDNLGRLEDREEAAASFKDHILAIENPQHEEDPLIDMF